MFAVDAFTTSQKLAHIGRGVRFPEAPDALPREAGLPPFLILNWMVPNYQRRMFGAKQTDGVGWNLVCYCRLNPEVAAAWRADGSVSPAVALLKRFMHPTLGQRLRGERLKCIIGLADVDEPGFGPMTRQLVGRYNYKPFLSKTASTSYAVRRGGV